MNSISGLDGSRLLNVEPFVDIDFLKSELSVTEGLVELAYTYEMSDVFGGGFTRASNITPNNLLFELKGNYEVDWIVIDGQTVNVWDIGESGIDVLSKQDLDYVYQDIFQNTYLSDDELNDYRQENGLNGYSDEEIQFTWREQVFDDIKFEYGI